MNIGYVRITVYVLMPMMLAMICVVTCTSITHQFEMREKQRYLDMLGDEKEKKREKMANASKGSLEMQIKMKKAQKRRSSLGDQARDLMNSGMAGATAGCSAVTGAGMGALTTTTGAVTSVYGSACESVRSTIPGSAERA